MYISHTGGGGGLPTTQGGGGGSKCCMDQWILRVLEAPKNLFQADGRCKA